MTGAESWEDEVYPLVLESGLQEGKGEGGGEAAKEIWSGSDGASWRRRRRLGVAIDGLFTDSPGELWQLLGRLR